MKTRLFFLFLITFSLTVFLPHTATAEVRKLRLLEGVQTDSVVFSPDGQTLTGSGSDNIVRLWDVHTGAEKRRFIGHTRDIYSVVFSPDGQFLASGSFDRTVRLWDVHTGVEKQRLAGHTNAVTMVVFSPDGQTLASSSFDRTVRLWDVHAVVVEKQRLIGHMCPRLI